MFEYLKDYKHILVSGMQRSGTTICMRMIQYDLEIEKCYWPGYDLELLSQEKQSVYHGPGLSHLLHGLKPENEDDLAIVWMKRDENEILSSLMNFRWGEERDFENYGIPIIDNIISNHDYMKLIAVKKFTWENQKKYIKNFFEVEYESLREHPLWCEPEVRKDFEFSKQTSPKQGLLRVMEDGKLLPGSFIVTLDVLLDEYPKEKWIPPWSK